MPIITALKQQKRHADRVNVYLDGAFAFGLNQLDAAPLRQGQHLSEADIAALKDQDAVARAVDHIARFLSYRPRSIDEVRRNLLQKDLSPAVVEAAIERMTHLGYLDDVAFARFWVENRNAFKPLSERALRYELRRKGVSSAIIDTVLAESSDESEAAYQAATTRLRRLRGSTPEHFTHQLGQFLQRRGFSYETCRQIIDQLQEDIHRDDPDYFAVTDDL